MNNKYYIIALLICLILVISACNRSGAATGSAPRTPFIGGTAGITMDFEKDSPPPEVTDDATFAFNAIVRLKNDGEARVDSNDIRLKLVGFDPGDFQSTFSDVDEVQPDDDLEAKKRDAEGNIIDGTTTFATFPKGDNNFIPNKFPGNTEFTFRVDACYNYDTQANTKLCILKDMINIRDDSICRPTGIGTSGRQTYSSSAPVQIQDFRQSVVGRDKISFSFDIVLSSNADIFFDAGKQTPGAGFDTACPRDPTTRRQRENQVWVELKEIPTDPIFQNLKCGGLSGNTEGIVKLVNGRRTITCTSDLDQDRNDLEKVMSIKLDYNVLDNKEAKVLVKHLADT